MHLPIIGDLVKQVRTPPVRPADRGGGGVYMSLSSWGYYRGVGLRPLTVSRVKCGGRTLSRPLSASVCGKHDMPSMRLYERIA